MAYRTYSVELTGQTPLLMHSDNIDWADRLKKWQKNPLNKAASEAGDDRSPAWTWIGNLYREGGLVVIPSDNIMTVLREGGARCPTGKRQGTFKSATQSGLVVNEPSWPVLIGNKQVPTATIDALAEREEPDFGTHVDAARDLGFELFVKRAKIGTKKHVRVRPKFNVWTTRGTLMVLDDTITTEVLANILEFAGRFAGLGDWRPSSPMKPGKFGTFSAVVKQL